MFVSVSSIDLMSRKDDVYVSGFIMCWFINFLKVKGRDVDL